jgi:hypothetical protein
MSGGVTCFFIINNVYILIEEIKNSSMRIRKAQGRFVCQILMW